MTGHAAIVLTLLMVAVPAPGTAQSPKKNLSVEDIYVSDQFQLKGLSSPAWVDGGRKISYLEVDTATHNASLMLYTVADGSRQMIVDGSSLKTGNEGAPFRVASYAWSSDQKRILLSGSVSGRRPVSGGNFGLFNIRDRSFRLLSDTSAPQVNIKFSPDGSRIGFVRSNNLFVVDVESGAETQLTFDGSDDVLNGTFDWVYEEEFGISDGWQWSPDGKKIAFWRLDQSGEPTFPLVGFSADNPHAKTTLMRYPKAGDRNAAVTVGVVDLATGQTRWMDIGSNPDIYVPRIKWTPSPDLLCIERLNRLQDTLDLLLANVVDGTIRTLLTQTDTAWIRVDDNLTFLQKTPQFLWTSDRDGFMHIYLYGMDGTLLRQVTKGEWEVTQVAGVDEKRKLVYFIGTQASPLERQLYSIRLDGSGMRRLTREAGVHAVELSPDDLIVLDTYSSASAPPAVTLRTNGGETVARLIVNTLEPLAEYLLGDRRFFKFSTPGGITLNGWMITPPGFNPERKYPVLMYVYGGPGSQTVLDAWGGTTYLWHQMLAEKGYIVVSVDNRGTGARGKAFLQQTYRRLGLREAADQVDAARYLASLPYVDASRIGIWGWSFGGYMTCMAMTLGAEVFRTGVAIAPVTSWRYYDTIYTERYMQTPSRNPDGYNDTSPITYASRLRGNLLIVHGTTDDNVHWQNTIVFVNELIRENKQVQSMFYPGRNHGIYGDNATRHLRTMMLTYILNKL